MLLGIERVHKIKNNNVEVEWQKVTHLEFNIGKAELNE